MYRPDGSYDSGNNPTRDNRYGVLDFGIYTAQVMDVTYPDDTETSVDNDQQAPEVTYAVMIIGGERDGQTFSNAVAMSQLGGNINYEERIYKKTTTLLHTDPADLILNLENVNKLNGDIVYIQFINGDLRFPIIIGAGRHPDNKTDPAQSSDGQRMKSSFNGITREIDREGVYTWTKANGLYSPTPYPVASTGQVLQDSWAPLPGYEEAVQITLDNEFKWNFKMNVTPGSGMEIAVDGVSDELKVTSLTGNSIILNGISDSFEFVSLTGMSVKWDGLSDKFTLNSLTGAAIELDGISDKISFSTTAGGALTIDGAGSETSLQNTAGAALKLTATETSLLDPTGAGIKVANGLIAMPSGSGEDPLKILGELLESISTATYAGFGAPGSNAVKATELFVRMKLVTG